MGMFEAVFSSEELFLESRFMDNLDTIRIWIPWGLRVEEDGSTRFRVYEVADSSCRDDLVVSTSR